MHFVLQLTGKNCCLLDAVALRVKPQMQSDVLPTEDDVPGASLGGRKLEDLLAPELKRWLACRGVNIQTHFH